MKKPMEILLEDANVELVCRSESRLLRNLPIEQARWATLVLPWSRRIYYPVGMTYDEAIADRGTICHELTHVRQSDDVGNFTFFVLYFLVPLPIGLAWYRMTWEAEAFTVQYLADPEFDWGQFSEMAVDLIGGRAYGWAWPKGGIRSWIDRCMDELEEVKP